MNNGFIKISTFLVIFSLIFVWIFSGWPQIWQDPPIPPEVLEVQAATTGSNFPSTVVNDTGIVGTSWGNPGNAVSSNDTRAVSALAKNAVSNYLKATGFGFSIPDNAQIDGITVEWEESEGATQANGGIKDNAVRIVKGGVIGATDKSNANFWPAPASEAFVSYGGAADLWGETWTAADINSANFGAAISAKDVKVSGGGAAENAQIDSVKITVTYTPVTMTVGTTGTQVSTLDIPSNNQYVGGAFTFVTDISTATTTQIIVTDTGSVNANANLSNIDLYYETAATVCSSETYGGGETLFGTAASFNGSEKATVSGSMSVGTTEVCVYVVLDIGSGTTNSSTLDIEISDPSTEVTVAAGTVTPATVIAVSGSTTLQVPTNDPPVVSNVVLDGGTAITLTENTTKSVSATADVSDINGADDIVSATSTIYRSVIGAGCTADDNNCYKVSSCTFSGATSTVTCTANVQFFADPTDASSTDYSAQNWLAEITVTDSASATGASSTLSGVELNTLWAINVTGPINYGSVSPGSDTGGTTPTVTVKNTGNAAIDVDLYGTDMTLGGSTIGVTNQKYATSTFTYSSCTVCTALSSTPAAYEVDLLKPTSATPVTDLIYWGLAVSEGTAQGVHNGTNTFTAVGD